MKKTVPVFVNRQQLATQLGINPGTVFRAHERRRIPPDALDSKGAPLWDLKRLGELEQLLHHPEIVL